MAVADTVTVTIDVRNDSRSTVRVPAPESMGCSLRVIHVVTSAEQDVTINPGCFSRMILYPPVELNWGESLRYTVRWTPSSSTIDGAPAGAHAYFIYPAVPVDGKVHSTNQGELVFVQ